MTDTPRPWDRRTPDSDPAYDAVAAYLDTGSRRDAYRQRRSGNEKAPLSHRRDRQSASRHGHRGARDLAIAAAYRTVATAPRVFLLPSGTLVL